jgi:DNA-binding CsgD family transcriptional regulator
MEYNVINEFSENENSIKMVLDMMDNKILFVSENVKKFCGYSEKEFIDGYRVILLSLLSIEDSNYLNKIKNWVKDKNGEYSNFKMAIYGINIKHKDGRKLSILSRLKCFRIKERNFKTTEESFKSVVVITFDDVSHLMKANYFWGRIEFGKETEANLCFTSIDKELKTLDTILTERERETLRLLAEGKESKEIGKILFISPHTVDNHRRNMITKMGVRDTTGLIHLCKMSGII